MNMKIENHSFPLKSPFAITGYVFNDADTILVTLESDGYVGRGEATGIYYENETPKTMMAELEPLIGQEFTFASIQQALPRGGARNALDCAFWDLTAKQSNKSIWDLLSLTPKILSTVATVPIDTPKAMAELAVSYNKFPNLKIKLSNDEPIARLEAIRAARPDATLIVDVNQGWSFDELREYIPAAQKLGLAMIEQPLPRGGDHELEGFKSPIPLGADESCLDAAEYETAAKRYDVINIKLDKCGGLTEALKIVKLAMKDGKGLMIGNMTGSSLSMAPSYVIGQYCQYIDLDGPLFLQNDVDNALTYSEGGMVSIPTSDLWG